MRTRTASLLLACLCGGLLAAPVLARAGFSNIVVPYRSIGGVPLRATPSQIEQRFGRPDSVFRAAGKIDGLQYNAIPVQIQVDFDTSVKGDPASEIVTNADDFHTVKGIRNGTTVKTLRRRLRGYPYLGCSSSSCHISRGGSPGSPGSSETIFDIENGRVAGFAIAYNFRY